MTPATLADLEQELRQAIEDGDREKIERIGAEVDRRAEAERQPSDLLAAALWYAEQGLRVFALHPGTKIPRKGTNGLDDATSDPEQIRAWWAAVPAANVAIATGHQVDVIDVDGLAGQVSLAQNLHAFAGLNVLGTVCTPRPGGMHLFIPATGGGNRAGVLPGIDHRGLGGYVVAPPSVNADGQAYAWMDPLQLDRAPGPHPYLTASAAELERQEEAA
jgi:hypothetical protein